MYVMMCRTRSTRVVCSFVTTVGFGAYSQQVYLLSEAALWWWWCCWGRSCGCERHVATLPPPTHAHTHARMRSSRQISLCLPPPELESKLGWIPGSIAKAMSFRQDFDLQTRVLQLLDEIVIPRGESCVLASCRVKYTSTWYFFRPQVPPMHMPQKRRSVLPGTCDQCPPPPISPPPFPCECLPLLNLCANLDVSCVEALRDEARAVGLAHLRHGMDLAARQGLTWILQVRGGELSEVTLVVSPTVCGATLVLDTAV